MTPPSVLVATAITTMAAAATSAWSLRRAAVATLVGDEYEYAAVATGTPGPAPFRRMPGYPWLLRRCGSLRRARGVGAVASVAAVGAAAASAVHVAGGWPGLLAGMWLALAAERVLLSARLWPAAALACAALVLLRIDGAATAACVAIALWRTPLAAVTVAAACVGALAFAAVRRRVRGCEGPVDTTAWFNVRVAADRLRDGRRPLEPDLAALAATWADENDHVRSARARDALAVLVRHPFLWGRQVLRRAAVLLGPDSFGRHRLLPSYRPPLSGVVAASIQVAGPVMVTLAVAGAATGAAPAVALYCGLQVLALALFHARTRFRAVVLPARPRRAWPRQRPV